jgi:hypothetical protein
VRAVPVRCCLRVIYTAGDGSADAQQQPSPQQNPSAVTLVTPCTSRSSEITAANTAIVLSLPTGCRPTHSMTVAMPGQIDMPQVWWHPVQPGCTSTLFDLATLPVVRDAAAGQLRRTGQYVTSAPDLVLAGGGQPLLHAVHGC